MHYLYHHVPKDLVGNILFPLNNLRKKFPSVYENQVAKYVGREQVMQQRIPILDNCLWNDVLFMTSLNPQELFDARREAGWGDIEPQQYYKIDPKTLDTSKLAVYLFEFKGSNIRSSNELSDFTEYNYDDLDKYAIIPKATKEYFKHEHEVGEPRIKLFYRYIPHIMYKGEIDISEVEIITVN